MEWYYKIGSILSQTLLILGISPVLDTMYTLLKLRFIQWRDCGYIFKPKSTDIVNSNSKTVQ